MIIIVLVSNKSFSYHYHQKHHLNGITTTQAETTKDVDSSERASSCSFSVTDVSDLSEVKVSLTFEIHRGESLLGAMCT